MELANLLKYDYKTKTFYKNSPFIAGTEGETIRIMLSLLPNFEEENLIKWLSKKSMSVDGKPVDNLLETLEQIQEKNIIMGVATNDSVSSALNQLGENNIKRFFDYIYGFDSVAGSMDTESSFDPIIHGQAQSDHFTDWYKRIMERYSEVEFRWHTKKD